MAKLVTIAELDDLNQAYVLKSRLESEGIRTFIQNENINTLLPMGGFSGIRLQVNLLDSFRTMDIIYDEEKDS